MEAMADTTTIEIDRETWRRLNQRKAEPGESFDGVVVRLLDKTAADETDHPAPGVIGAEVDRPSEAPADLDAALEGVDFPTGRDRSECVAAVVAARTKLAEHGPATMRELVRDVMPNHPAGYAVEKALSSIESGERYRGGWWRSVVKPGLEAAPDVEGPGPGGNEWRVVE